MEMAIAQLRETLKEIDWEVAVDSIDETLPLRDQGLDSLDMITLFFFLEERFAIKISENDTVNLITLKDISDYLNSR
ncbi:MAG: phosphopantetheine-binding protein [Thermodesulfovibrionales bacterium]